MGRNVTLRDVAAAAGVGLATASEVLKGCGKYSDSTVEKVWKAVQALGYTPNKYAMKFFGREQAEHQSTGLLMRITHYSHEIAISSTKHLEAERMYWFEQACQEKNYAGTNYCIRHGKGFHSRLMLNDMVDGVVLGLSDRELLQNMSKRLPCVATDINVEPDEINMPVINNNLLQGYRTAFQEIRKKGLHGKIAILRGFSEYDNDSVITRKNRSVYLEKAAECEGIELDPKHKLDIEITPSTNDAVLTSVAAPLAHLIKKEGVRIIGIREISHLKILRNELEKYGVRLPDDAVIVVNNLESSKIPGVVSIHYDWEKMMSTAVDVLIRRIDGKEDIFGKYMVPCGHVDTEMID